MDEQFKFLNLNFFTRAAIFPGSLGTFRYRFQRTGWIGDGTIQAWVYENTSFELAQEVETESFLWTEDGIASLQNWLIQKLRERGTEPYRIPYPVKRSDVLEQSQ